MIMKYRSFRIGDICSIVKGTYSSLKTEQGEFPLVVTADFRRTSNTFQLEGPAVCVPLISSTGHGDAALHRVHYQEGKFALANLLVALLPKDPSICDPKYLYQLLMAKKNEFFVPLMQGTANVSLKERDIANVEISLPTLEDQQRIVARIEELAAWIEEARELRRRAVVETDALLKSGMKILFSFPNHNFQPISKLVTIKGGGTPSKSNPYYWEGTIPWISPKDMKIKEITDSMDHISEVATKESAAKLLDPGLVLIVVRGMILARMVPTAILRVPAAINQDMKALMPGKDLLPEYLCGALWAFNNQILELVEKSTHDTRKLETSKLLDFRIPVPSLDQQRIVVCRLKELQSKLDALKRHQAETAAELDALLPAVLERAFRGEL